MLDTEKDGATTYIDENGIKLIVSCKNVYLKLPSEQWIRTIGKIRPQDGFWCFIVHRDINKHLFKKSNSWGVCDMILTDLKPDFIVIEEGKRKIFYISSLGNFQKNKTYLTFSKLGFERQAFLELGLWRKCMNVKEAKEALKELSVMENISEKTEQQELVLWPRGNIST